MPTFSNYPYGCREVRVKNGAAASVANKAAQTLKFKEAIASANLMGNDRVVAVHPRELRGARKLVLASGGWQKYDVIRGAMRLIKPHVLVTDELVAERLAAEVHS